MSAIYQVMRGRRAAERLMVDRAAVRRKTGETVGENTWQTVPVYETVYVGRMKLQTYEGHEVDREAAGQIVVQQRSTIHFPVGSFRSKPGDIVTVTESFDPLLVGRSWRIVQEYPVKTFATAYRVFVDENIGEIVPPLEVTP